MRNRRRSILIALVICIALAPACMAESSTGSFLSDLSDAWDSFLGMAEEAGRDAAGWVEESGVIEWAEGRANDIAAWAEENGLTGWAQETLSGVETWFDEAGIAEWAAGASSDFRAFIEENRPAVEGWLAEAGQEVREAWDTLANADRHTQRELQAACEAATESPEESAG